MENREEIREMVKEMISEALKEFALEIIEREKMKGRNIAEILLKMPSLSRAYTEGRLSLEEKGTDAL